MIPDNTWSLSLKRSADSTRRDFLNFLNATLPLNLSRNRLFWWHYRPPVFVTIFISIMNQLKDKVLVHNWETRKTWTSVWNSQFNITLCRLLALNIPLFCLVSAVSLDFFFHKSCNQRRFIFLQVKHLTCHPRLSIFHINYTSASTLCQLPQPEPELKLLSCQSKKGETRTSLTTEVFLC